MTMSDLGIDRLPPEERVTLALEIWASLEGERPSPPLTDSQRAELMRRDGEMASRPGIAMTWQQIRASVEGER